MSKRMQPRDGASDGVSQRQRGLDMFKAPSPEPTAGSSSVITTSQQIVEGSIIVVRRLRAKEATRHV